MEDWERTGGPAVDHVIDAAEELSKRTGMTFRESVETIIETVYQRLGWKGAIGAMIPKKRR